MCIDCIGGRPTRAIVFPCSGSETSRKLPTRANFIPLFYERASSPKNGVTRIAQRCVLDFDDFTRFWQSFRVSLRAQSRVWCIIVGRCHALFTFYRSARLHVHRTCARVNSDSLERFRFVRLNHEEKFVVQSGRGTRDCFLRALADRSFGKTTLLLCIRVRACIFAWYTAGREYRAIFLTGQRGS